MNYYHKITFILVGSCWPIGRGYQPIFSCIFWTAYEQTLDFQSVILLQTKFFCQIKWRTKITAILLRHLSPLLYHPTLTLLPPLWMWTNFSKNLSIGLDASTAEYENCDLDPKMWYVVKPSLICEMLMSNVLKRWRLHLRGEWSYLSKEISDKWEWTLKVVMND